MKYRTNFRGRIVMIGFGSIGQGILALLLQNIVPADRLTVITADERGKHIADEFGVELVITPVTQDNYHRVLTAILEHGDFLLNLSVGVSSLCLIALCRQLGALYLDTSIEPWPGCFADPSLSMSQRSNYALLESLKEFRVQSDQSPTALITHGANPGLVSHFLKQALLDIGRDTGHMRAPLDRNGWAAFAQALGIKVIHIAERDTQASAVPKQAREFVNTWSISGCWSESVQPSEMGWGTHEKRLPHQARTHGFGSGAGIYFERPGYRTEVRSWTPLAGPTLAYQITHTETIAIAEYLTLRDHSNDDILYRPSVCYAYHPCDDAMISIRELAARNGRLHEEHRLMMDEILPSGVDELGVLLMGHARGAYWFGSRLTIDEARRLAPHNNATSLQVAAGAFAGMVWAIESPERGVVTPDEIDHVRVMEIAEPYLGEIIGVYSDWTPIVGRRPHDDPLFPENVDIEDPWQYLNFQVR